MGRAGHRRDAAGGGAALCIADTDDAPTPELAETAGWGYLRLRGEAYSEEQLAQWVERVRARSCAEVLVFFKHEDAGTGPKLALQFAEMFSAAE